MPSPAVYFLTPGPGPRRFGIATSQGFAVLEVPADRSDPASPPTNPANIPPPASEAVQAPKSIRSRLGTESLSAAMGPDGRYAVYLLGRNKIRVLDLESDKDQPYSGPRCCWAITHWPFARPARWSSPPTTGY